MEFHVDRSGFDGGQVLVFLEMCQVGKLASVMIEPCFNL
jgi:hypothetical protein